MQTFVADLLLVMTPEENKQLQKQLVGAVVLPEGDPVQGLLTFWEEGEQELIRNELKESVLKKLRQERVPSTEMGRYLKGLKFPQGFKFKLPGEE